MGPLPLIALAFTAGVAIGLQWPAPTWSLIAASAGSVVALALAIRARRYLALVAVAGAVAIGWARAPEPASPSAAEPNEKACPRIYSGQVRGAPVLVGEKTRAIIDLHGRSKCLRGRDRPSVQPFDGTLVLTTMAPRRPTVERGDRLRVVATARPIRAHANPPGSTLPEWSGTWSAVVDRAQWPARTDVGGSSLLGAFDALRGDLAGFWDRTLGPDRARLARALSLGEAAILDPAQKERFRRTGTAHLLAVSGLHLGLVVLFAFALARAALVRVTRLSSRVEVGRLAALAAIPLAIGFALLAGGRPPVVRACVMAVCALVGRALGRRASVGEAIALAGAGLLAWDPEDLLRPGFQLSFSAVLGFVLVFGRRDPRVDYAVEPETRHEPWLLTWTRRVGRWAVRVVTASAAATAATSPLVLYHFDRLSLIGVPVNAIAVPIAGFVIMPGLLAATALAGPLPGPAELVARLVGKVLAALDSGLAALAELPCTLDAPGPLATGSTCLACCAVLAALARWRRPALALGSAAILVLAASFALDAPRVPPDRLTVDFLDVGQGDATLLSFPDGSHWLVDAGGNPAGTYDVGEHVVVPTLRALGVRRIDTLVLTHPDPDHVGGMPAVARSLEVGRIWDNGQGAAEGAVAPYGELLEIASRRNIRVERTRAICGGHARGRVQVDVLHPCHDDVGYDPGLSFNDNSIALHLAHGRVSLLLPGDLGREGEELLLARHRVPRVDLLKLGHHGSAGSSTAPFLDAAAPKAAIASAGAWNRFGLPSPSLLDRLERRDVRVLRTDRQGAIRVTTDGQLLGIAPRDRAPEGRRR